MPFHEFVVTSVTATFTSLDMDDATEQGHDAWGYNHGQEDGTSETETERSASKGGSLLRETGHCTSGMARWDGERSRLKRKEIERRQQGNGICMTCRRDIRRQNDINARIVTILVIVVIIVLKKRHVPKWYSQMKQSLIYNAFETYAVWKKNPLQRSTL